ncbi:hypothetical protein NKDENANG_00175 [Candidatus Entotheonellaceae bacterium PAL068K]
MPLPRLPRLLTLYLVYLFGVALTTTLSLIFLPIALKEGGSLIQKVPTYVNFMQNDNPPVRSANGMATIRQYQFYPKVTGATAHP